MATLEKIRSKSVLLFIIIIVALLAFILGDFLTSGRTYFGSGTTVAKAGNAKVDYHDYQARINAASEQSRAQNQNVDNDELSQQVLQSLLLEKMKQNEYDRLGITVTDAELTEALTGANLHPYAAQAVYMLAQQLGRPGASGAEIVSIINNPQQYGYDPQLAKELAAYWAGLENQLEAQMKNDKFMSLVNGLFTASQLDAKSLYNDIATTRHFTYAAKDINSVADEDVTVTDADRREAWAAEKGLYRISEPMRSIDYIMVRIEPSQADRLAGTQEVEDALLALNQTEGTEAAASNPRFVVNTGSLTRSQITDNRLKQFIDTAHVGQAAMLNHATDRYTLVKLLGVSSAIDSINISMLRRADGGQLDSLLAQVKGGAKVTDLADGTNVLAADSLWNTLAGPNVPAYMKDAFTNNAIGSAFVLADTIQGQPVEILYQINQRHAPVSVYEVATFDYTIDPSQETLTKLSGDLHTFVSNNSSAADFSKNAADAGYTVQNTAVMASNPHVANAADSRPAVKWLMNAKKGAVMPVYQDNRQTYLLTAAVKDIYDGEYIPYDSELIADGITLKAMQAKKAAKLIDEYKGKATDVAGYAKLMETEPQNADAIFNAPMLGTIGFGEAALQGAIAAAKPGTVVGPVEGNNSVVVFVVTGEEQSPREYTFEEYSNQVNRALGIGGRRPMQDVQVFQLLLGDDKIENNSLNFIQGFGE